MSLVSLRRNFVTVVLLVAAAAACSRSAQSHLDKATAYAAAGNDAAAVLELRRAVEKDPSLAPARLQLAELYLKQGNGEGALAEFVRAADLMPTDATVQVKAGALLLVTGKPEEAKARADRALALNPKLADALVLRANALAGLNDLDAALAQMQEALTLDPTVSRQMNLGALQQVRGNVAEAEAAFRQAVATAPTSGVAQLALGQFLWSSGRPLDAESAFKAALALDPNGALPNRALAAFYLRTERGQEAEPFIRKAVEVLGSPEARLALADYYTAMRRPADAVAVLNSLADNAQFWAVAKSRVAEIQHAEGKTDEAFRAADEVIARAPTLASARVVRGRLLLADGRIDEALRDAQEAVRSAPRGAEGHYLLGSVQLARRDLDAAATAFGEVLRLNPRATPAQVQLALIALQRNELPAATQLAEEAAGSEPGNLAARLVLARALLARGDLDRAAAVTSLLVEGAPASAPVHTQAGLVAFARGDRPAARAAFEKALSLEPRLVEPLAALASMDVEEKAPARARERVEARLRQTPNDSRVLALAGTTWAATGDVPKGTELLRRAIDADPSNLDAYAQLGSLYLSERKLDEAAREYDTLAARQPGAVGPPTMAGLILQAAGKDAEARVRYERLVEQNPRAAVAANNLAWMYASRGEQLDKALQLAQAAKAELPDNPEVNDTLGFVYLRKQLPSLALAPLRLAVATVPRNPAFHYHLGLAHAGVGDRAAARESLETALRLDANFGEASEARKLLATLD